MHNATPWKFCPICGEVLNNLKVDPMALCKCSCGFTHYDNPVPIVAGLIELPEGILLVHSKTCPVGEYGLVSGFLGQGETPQDAIIREVKEELGLTAEIDHLIGYYPVAELGQIAITFALNACGQPELGEELDDVKLIPREKLVAWDIGTGPAVRDWLELHKHGSDHSQPIMKAIELFGRRWALRVLWELSEKGSLGFRQLRTACGDLSPDTLSTRLKDLSAAGLIDNINDTGSYQLTSSARALRPHLIGVADWAKGNLDP